MSSTKKNNTFRFPFDINPMVFIVLAVLFFILSIKQVSDFLMPKVNVSILSEKIQQDAHAKINKFNHMFENKTVFEHAIQNSLTPSQHEYLMNLALKFHLYDNEKLVFCNDNYLSAIHDSLPERTPKYYKSKNGHYLLYAIRWGDANRYKAVLTIPVKSENLFQSDYMKSYFFVVFRPFRDLLYDFHRTGMDNMSTDAITSRRTIAQGIEKLKTVHQAKPASYNLQVFFNAKYNEIVEIFKQADPAEKTKLFNTLQIIDPGHISQYQNMMRGS